MNSVSATRAPPVVKKGKGFVKVNPCPMTLRAVVETIMTALLGKDVKKEMGVVQPIKAAAVRLAVIKTVIA
jgi:hypothetical protein